MSDPNVSPSFDETGAGLSPLDDYAELPEQGDPNVEPVLVSVDDLPPELEPELDEDFDAIDAFDAELDTDELDTDELDTDEDDDDAIDDVDDIDDLPSLDDELDTDDFTDLEDDVEDDLGDEDPLDR